MVSYFITVTGFFFTFFGFGRTKLEHFADISALTWHVVKKNTRCPPLDWLKHDAALMSGLVR